VEYDCKVATVTMEDEAVLTERSASKAIRNAGYEVVSFERGLPPTRTAFLFRLSDFDPARRASLEDGLREDLEGADGVAVDSLGRATVVAGADAGAVQAALSASLARRGLAAEGFETRTWPKLEATYLVAISWRNDPAETRKVADALAGVPKVVAVHVHQDTGTATLWLEEPCDALEANVRAALTPGGFEVARFELLVD
jgi:hypothetical protein